MAETPNIEQEKKELDAVPKIPISKFSGRHGRCHICGQLFKADNLKSYDTHVRGGSRRLACKGCHPQRSHHA